ncbi:DEAD/DEAH box helicase family protein [Brevibacillus porteri]|uniref:Helicase/UvrB N-terminal domain-containing protein n=1 Tax=Brevibacillus porteri TaxID=2126350 RepID=A0ABX5FGE9_9BACL|nr:DEAD/DEAH box helicase family protein [Brevibacillus porteri]MED1801995.1 DEAD/DEAH box helicase family protein [Brevibacillus porteri]MED2132556.1 DEAD/DEAH box helicase family protein [Brevibacillus porteri]MED2745436.1 DEAD/DEAH box helicase family protein [Brevibacillus porteri]MED2814287.1 DEAD/DEAH box helicase family protein [Brevibacillus porteri]MED2892536.1 DEAD/DEAH box helicase family protein [Brevibacillus porteri]
MTTVNIIDAPCGYGKTSWAIQYMNEMCVDSHKFIYVTPFLDEVTRIQQSVHSRKFYEPESIKGETKLDDLHRLLGQGKDIATTHALFQMANAETRELIRSNNYTLVLDEVMNVIEQVPLKKDDLKLLFEAGVIDIVTDGKGLKFITWLEDKSINDTEYNHIMQMALTGNLMFCDNSALIWNLPCDIFKMFNNVFILTYLFKGQFQRYYYDLHGIKYRYLSVVKNHDQYSLVPYADRCHHDKSRIASLINIYKGKLNNIGDNRNALSTSWFGKNGDLIVTLKNNTYNFLTNKCKATKDTAMWTTVKGNKESKKKDRKKDSSNIKNKVRPKGFKDSFVPMTSRATNEYENKIHLAYLINRFMNPIEKKFFEQYGVSVDQEAWALSELIQWVWRSRIRKTIPEHIDLYIPSSRMRGLLEKYLSSDFFETAPENTVIDEPPSDWHL